jgi:nucleoside-diphosphate-sugar epimerase
MTGNVVIVGGGAALSSRVVRLAAADPSVDGVLALVPPASEPPVAPAGVEVVRMHLSDPALKEALRDAEVVIHLGGGDVEGPDGLPASADPVDGVRAARELFDAAAAVGVAHLVVLSSAMVYGAWANNPVPLTEDAPLRPDPSLPYAAARAETERLAMDWRDGREGFSVALLRPAVSVAAESSGWLSVSPWSAAAMRALGEERPSQYLHLDDLASAVDHARRQRLDGPFNVSPEGWIPPDVLIEFAGPTGRLHLPSGMRRRWDDWQAEVSSAGRPAGWAYTRHPWVVANDRLRATGWAPRHRNEEVYVEADPGGPLSTLSARRRQELSLAAVAATVVGTAGLITWLVRRRRS